MVAKWFGFGEFYAVTCRSILKKGGTVKEQLCTIPEVPSVLVVQPVAIAPQTPKRMLRPRYSAPGLGVHCRDSPQFETRLHHSPYFLYTLSLVGMVRTLLHMRARLPTLHGVLEMYSRTLEANGFEIAAILPTWDDAA